jgi:SAM-dependent methyltransferase
MSGSIGLAPGVPQEAAGQDAAKYGSGNPVVKGLLDRWTGRMRELLGPLPGTIVDVGVGEGLCIERILGDDAAAARVVGVEYRFDKAAVAHGKTGVEAVVGDAGQLPFPDRAVDLVTCIEVLEHLPTVAPALAELARVARSRCVVSVPWEPWFRLGNLARGKNVGRFGNDPEHLRAFTPARLRRALRPHFTEVTVTPVFPWLVADARR